MLINAMTFILQCFAFHTSFKNSNYKGVFAVLLPYVYLLRVRTELFDIATFSFTIVAGYSQTFVLMNLKFFT